jgi:DNA-binding CsgD family transcriptional regulator/uncharacterized glyoxalase superfamily protein PhnB
MPQTTKPRRTRPRGRPAYADVLTRTEWAVLLLVRKGQSNGEIAQLRGCRVDTVKFHISEILAKLDLPDREALRRWSGSPLPNTGGIDLRDEERKYRMNTQTKAPGKVTMGAPMFLVDDVVRMAEWYRDHLGFEIGEYFREHHHEHGEAEHEHSHDDADNGIGEAVFVILAKEAARLMLGKTVEPGLGVSSNRTAKALSSDAYYWVDGIREYYQWVRERGTQMWFEYEKQFYGLAEFAVKDPDGRQITFGGVPTEG